MRLNSWVDPNSGSRSIKKSSVADPGCLPVIPDPDFFPSWIPDLTTTRRGWKHFFVLYFCSSKFHKTENYKFFEHVQKKIGVNWQRGLSIPTQKIVTKLSEILFCIFKVLVTRSNALLVFFIIYCTFIQIHSYTFIYNIRWVLLQFLHRCKLR